MNIFKWVKIATIIAIPSSILFLLFVFIRNEYAGFEIKSSMFLIYTSMLLSLNYILIEYCYTIPKTIKKVLVLIGLGLILFAAVVLFNLLPFEHFWFIIIGLSILFILAIELQLLGWTIKQQPFYLVLLLALSLLSNLFIAILFFFALSFPFLNPFIYISGVVSLLIFFYGLYYYQPKQIWRQQP